MDVQEYSALPYHVMQIGVHELKHQVEVSVVLSPACTGHSSCGISIESRYNDAPVNIEQLDNVWVVTELPEKDNFPECPLSVSSVAESVVDTLHGDSAARSKIQLH